jgi:glycosyltransferase involved in cell wall biosynthesis
VAAQATLRSLKSIPSPTLMNTAPKRTCMLVYAFYESDTRVLQYAKALVARGDSVDVFALRREGSPAFEVMDGVNVYRIQPRRVNERGRFAYLGRIVRFLLVSTLVLAKRHLSKPYDVVHVHSVPDFLVFAALVPKLCGARIILDIHDILPEFYASKFGLNSNSAMFRMLVFVERVSTRFADHVIVANHLWYETLSRSISHSKCTAIINYPDPSMFYPRAKAATGNGFRIVYPGSLNQHQGLDIALRAFAKVTNSMPGAEFHIYGEGPTKDDLMQLTSSMGLSERILFHEFLSTHAIADIMASSDLAVVPKRASSKFGNEAASTKIMEFMALGVPVIVSRTKVDSYYHDDSMVEFFESENVDELAEAIFRLWRSPKLRSQLAANALEYVHRNSWKDKQVDYFRLLSEQPVEPGQDPEFPQAIISSRTPEYRKTA